jgi:hypothetical protein
MRKGNEVMAAMQDRTKTILEWFQEHPGTVFGISDIMREFDTSRVDTANSVTHLLSGNHVVKVARGQFRLRYPDEKRNEFKVAEKAVVKPAKREVTKEAPPVVREWMLDRVDPEVFALIGNVPKDRIQALSPSTVIIWNSPRQREYMRNVDHIGQWFHGPNE